MRWTITVLLIFSAVYYGSSVDHSIFKTCEQSGFCRRLRKSQPENTNFALVSNSFKSFDDSVTFDLVNKINNHEFDLKIDGIQGDTFRVRIDEKKPLKKRYRVNDALKESPRTGSITVEVQKENEFVLLSGANRAKINTDPFKIDFYQNDVFSVSINAKGLMSFEHQRKKSDDDEPGSWEEEFNSYPDTKPYGPEAVALDFTFPQADILFGIPEHADSFALRSTQNSDPYRLFNLDTPYHELNSTMALYGSVPVLYGHGAKRTAGVFWHNAAETWVDIWPAKKKAASSSAQFISEPQEAEPPSARFMSESGIIDVFIMLGPTPLDAFKQYSDLTGTANLPQLFTLGYHQSRWNYENQSDVETVSANFDKYDIPMDTMWLDIEYTDGKRYFTWDFKKFPNPLGMIKNLTDLGRHLTIIIDPHYKLDEKYFFHKTCEERGYYVKTYDGKDYVGECWPGLASYPDFFNPEVRQYYADQFMLNHFNTTTADVMIWNDMNEPSVFIGPEKTMLKDNIHYGGYEHRDVHNLYGHMQLMGTFQGLLQRDPNQRPFILTRAHFAGSQRYAIIWTGDNTADWGYLQHAIKMCLTQAVSGFSFCGADVGGFFENPETELLERWYQAAAFMPFYRGHAHEDTKRREPWLFPESTCSIIREAIRKRYSYLPMWYTMFYEHEKYGLPVMRPILAHYPNDVNAFAIDSEFLLHDNLLVSPVMEKGVGKLNVYFPSKDGKDTGDIWYDVDDFEKHEKVGYETIKVDKNKVPVYQRGGSIIPKKEHIRRAATLMKEDPYSLVVCLDKEGIANGTLYIDDEKSYDYRHGKYIYTRFEFSGNVLKNTFVTNPNYKTSSTLEQVIIAGLKDTPKLATITTSGKSEELKVSSYKNSILIENPGVNMGEEFVITLKY